MRNIFLFTLILISSLSCTTSINDAQKIVDKAIELAGGEKYLHSTIEFDFRDRHYIAKREGGVFSYHRIFKDKDNDVHDYVTNAGFEREINGKLAEVVDTMKVKYTSSINSVIYFALLPYGLNDAAVQKKLLGETTIENEQYYKLEVTFAQEGGGEDYQDIFHYWINKNDFTIDFMSYSYEESDGIGLRLRKAYNPRTINGIRFVDYINYKPAGNATLSDLEELYKKGELEELSKIESINIKVQ